MSQPTYDLSKLFGAALETMTAQRQEINALDGYNGNHGDNMVENLRLITESLQEKSSQTPTEALKHASQQLQSHGRGGTSQYYATGLSQAAKQLQGRPSLDGNDVMSLVQSVLGAIPSEGHQPQPQAGSSVLDQVLGMSSGQPPQAISQDNDLGLDDVLNTLLPAGLAFLQAKQSGADTATAATQALASTLMGGQTNPLQASTPRAAAGGLVAQSILQALATRR
jgi:hypothetical protein